MAQTALLINIQRFSLHDGPGIRTTFFFKGCPLHCLWCHNPESQSFQPQVMHYTERCTGCRSCVRVCAEQAIYCENGIAETDSTKCIRCGECTDFCPNNAREISGKRYTADELLKEAAKDEILYEQSGGGVTLSGGEVMSQPIDFLEGFSRRLKDRGFNVAIDTCGYTSFSNFERILPYVDLFLYDMKCIDDNRHIRFTGVPASPILDNLKKLYDAGSAVNVRIPVIGNVNADDEELLRMCSWMQVHNVQPCKINLLPYHNTGSVKYERLRMSYDDDLMVRPSDERMEEIKHMFETQGFHNITIGG